MRLRHKVCLDRIIRDKLSILRVPCLYLALISLELFHIECHLRIIHQFKCLDRLFAGCESDDESFAHWNGPRPTKWLVLRLSYDLLYNPLSCKTEAFTLVLLKTFYPPCPLCRTFRDTRRADVKLLFTVRSFALNSLIVTAMSLARASFRLGNTHLLRIRVLSYFHRKKILLHA